eukprot:6182758-Pleurochrysis_carterae.AAC.3
MPAACRPVLCLERPRDWISLQVVICGEELVARGQLQAGCVQNKVGWLKRGCAVTRALFRADARVKPFGVQLAINRTRGRLRARA